MTRLDILNARLNMVTHNLLCYSATYSMGSAKAGYEKEWLEADNEATILSKWICEERLNYLLQQSGNNPPLSI